VAAMARADSTEDIEGAAWYCARMQRCVEELDWKLLMPFLTVATVGKRRTRAGIGSLRLRTQWLDSGRRSMNSYFLAKVADGNDVYFEVCRAQGFVEHCPPGTSAETIGFIQTKWLLNPRMTQLLKTKNYFFSYKRGCSW
jgi:hypothetical protein